MIMSAIENEIWKKISKWCDSQERSQQEARDKLYKLGLHRRDVETTIARLVSDGFINEERFAMAFARGKFRILHWGRIKIRIELKKKKVSEYCIRKSLQSIPDSEYRNTAITLFEKKLKTAKGDTQKQKQYSAARYVISRGFEPEIVMDLVGYSGD